LIEVVTVLKPLLAGERVSFSGEYVELSDAVIENPSPDDNPVDILIGGSNQRLMELGAGEADIVGLAGLGRTLPDGHSHEVNWSPGATAATVDRIRAAAAGRKPIIDALVQVVDPYPDRHAAATALAAEVESLEVDDALDCPYALFGTAESIAAQLREYEDRWGITSYCVRPPALDHIAEVMEELG
jgi:alkanesulfonate monooxygenase SsuD/methylene tetrahydromethanopterin reductase-like flavin-dependent oxidoreductase (luciferase family)